MQRIDRKTVRRWKTGDTFPHTNFIVCFRGHNYELETVADHRGAPVFRNDAFVYVLAIDKFAPYVNLDGYDLRDKPRLYKGHRDYGKDYQALSVYHSAYVEGDEIEELVGPRGIALADIALARALLPYVG